MQQIDATTAVKILVAAAPSGTAEPMMDAMRFLLEAARRGRINIRAFQGANPEHEPIPSAVLSDLEINFLARASRADDAGGEGEVVSLGWGVPASGLFPMGSCQTVARNVRFSCEEIEDIAADFVVCLKSGKSSPSPSGNFSPQRSVYS